MGSMSRGVSANIRKQPRHTGWYRRDLMSSHEPSFLGSLTMKSNREIQPRPLTAFFGTKVDEISFLQLHQMDLFAALGNPVHEGVPFSSTQEGTARARRKMASAAAEEMRHHFAIETLEKPGALRPQPYLYTCVRCKWIFRVNDSRGSITALDGLGRRLPEPENSKRIVTFRPGQCPAFSVFEYLTRQVQREGRFHSYLSRFVDALRSLTNGRGRGHRRAEQTAAS